MPRGDGAIMPRSLWPWFSLLALVILSRLSSMAFFPLIETTEPRYAEIARLMASSGDWITPWFEPGVPFWGKPPLSFWAQAASIGLFGPAEFAARLPSWLAMLLVVALIWRYASHIGGATLGVWSTLIFATMALSYVSAGAVMTDPFLAAGVTLSLVSFGMILTGRAGAWRWLFFVGLALGLLAKGPVALVLTGIPIALWAVTGGHAGKLPGTLPWLRGSLLVAALVVPWYVAAELKTPGFLDYFIVGEHLRRFTDPGWAGDLYGSAHDEPRGMIWVFWTWASFPWGLLALGYLAINLLRRRRIDLAPVQGRDSGSFLLFSALSPMLFFTLSGNILWTYVLPALPMTAILIARGLAARIGDSPRPHPLLLAVLLSIPVLVTVGGAAVTASDIAGVKTQRGLVDAYRSLYRPGDSPLIYIGKLPFSARFYSGGQARTLTPDQVSELILGNTHPRYFLALARKDGTALADKVNGELELRAESRGYLLMMYTRRVGP